LSDAGKLFSEGLPLWDRFRERRLTGFSEETSSSDLPLWDRFRERRPAAFSKEKSRSSVESEVCESASRPSEICSKPPREEDEKKSKSIIATVICFTSVTVYHGRENSQLGTIGDALNTLRLLDPGA
jgi:hypothetical protein